MAREVELHDGTILEFPDETSDDVIDRAVKTHLSQAQPPAPRSETDPTLWAGGKVPSTDPTEGNSFLRNTLIGAGKSVADTGRGLAQLFGAGPSEQEVAQQRELDAPLMATGGGVTGNILGAMAQTAIPVGGVARLGSLAGRAAPYVSAAARGAAFAGAQPIAEGESRLANTATGAALGAAGQGIASGAQAAAKRAVDSLSPVVRQSIESARAAGIPLNVAQVTNSAPIRAAQAVTKYLPFSGAAKAGKAQQEAFNRSVSRSFGADAPKLTEDVMKGARERLSKTFNDIYENAEIELTPDVMRNMAAIEREAFSGMVEAEAKVVRSQLDRVIEEASSGVLTGRKYQALRTALQRVESGQNPSIGRMVKAIRNELDDAAAQSVSADDAARLAKVRSQWANLRTAEDALKQVSGAAGDIRPASLYPLIRKGATKEMRELAKIGQNVLKETIGDSGTGPRNLWAGLLTGGGVTGGMAGGLAGAGAAVSGLAKLAAAGAVGGRILNSQAASKLLQQGRPTQGLARLVQPAPKFLPATSPFMAPLDIGTVYGYDRSDPRYQGD